MAQSPFHRPHQSYCWYESWTHQQLLKDLSCTSTLQTASAKAKPLPPAASPARAPLGHPHAKPRALGGTWFSSSSAQIVRTPRGTVLQSQRRWGMLGTALGNAAPALCRLHQPTGKPGSVLLPRAQKMLKFSLKLQAQEAETQGLVIRVVQKHRVREVQQMLPTKEVSC